MKKWIWLLLVTFVFAITGCSNTGSSQPPLSQMQIREMTTKEVEADYKTTFKATMAVLQDQEYIIENTDLDTGLIVAEKTANKNINAGDVLMVFFIDRGFRRNGRVMVTATVNEVNEHTSRVRLSIQEKNLTSGSYGSGTENVKNVQEAYVYEILFNQIMTEIERLKAMK